MFFVSEEEGRGSWGGQERKRKKKRRKRINEKRRRVGEKGIYIKWYLAIEALAMVSLIKVFAMLKSS